MNGNRGIDRDRLSYIDDIRSLVIFLVVMIHSSVTYSGIGGWYVIENASDSLGVVSMAIFGFFNSFNQAWFMGILFFFGGHFSAEALARKGSARFIKDRLLRLGIPLAGYMFVIAPLMLYYVAYPERYQPMGSFPELYFGRYLPSGMFLSQSGPLWFAEALLVFSIVFAAVTHLRGLFLKKGLDAQAIKAPPSVVRVLALVVLTACSAFILRLFWPIGTGWMNLQFCFFPAYVALFALGIRGATDGWFVSLSSGNGRRWFQAVLGIGIPCWIALMLAGGVLSGNMASINGGATWQSAAYCLWESFTAIGMSLGLTALFANRKGSSLAVSAFLSRNSFSVYVFHPVFLIALTKLFSLWALPPLAKALFIGVLAFFSTLVFAELVVRRVPGVRKYF